VQLDLIVIFIHAIAVTTGLWTMYRHGEFFEDFRMSDVLHGRWDAWLYIINSLSTALCVVEIAIRIGWWATINWKFSADFWMYAFLSFHAFSGILATVIHVVTNKLLRKGEFCALCKRNF